MAIRGMRAVFLSGAPLESEVLLSPWARRLREAHSNASENLGVFASLILVAHDPARVSLLRRFPGTNRSVPAGGGPPPPCDHGGFVFGEPHSFMRGEKLGEVRHPTLRVICR